MYNKQSAQSAVSLTFFNSEEGYLEPEFDPGKPGKILGYNYTYQYKDHLGNIRLSYEDLDESGTIDPLTEIKEENHYYPFGLKHKGYNNQITGVNHPYGYGGKEENNELGLEWLDFHARNYDASLGRWMNVDAKSFVYKDISPYSYTLNNPVNFIDPDGNIIRDKNGNIVFTTDGKQKTWKSTIEYNVVQNQNGTITFQVLESTYTEGQIYADNGTAVTAYSYDSSVVSTYTINAQGTVINKTSKPVNLSNNTSVDCKADCHGLTFSDNKLWINNDQVQTILDNDEVLQTGDETIAHFAVFTDNGVPIHSAVKNENGNYDDNSGSATTETDRSLGEASRGFTNGVITVADPSGKKNKNKGTVSFYFRKRAHKALNTNLGKVVDGVRKITKPDEIKQFINLLYNN